MNEPIFDSEGDFEQFDSDVGFAFTVDDIRKWQLTVSGKFTRMATNLPKLEWGDYFVEACGVRL